MKKITGLAVIYLIIFIVTGYSESLWTPDFKGFLSGVAGWRTGDIIHIALDVKSDLTISSSRSDSTQITLNFKGGEGGDLFSFLPEIDSSSVQNISDSHKSSFRTFLPARIMQIDEAGNALVSGTRLIVLDGASESVEISGLVSLKEIGKDKVVEFSNIADGRLVYRGFLSGEDVLSADDLVFSEAAPDTEGFDPDQDPLFESALQQVDGDVTGGDTPDLLQLSNEKRQELLLQYINRFINLVFPAP